MHRLVLALVILAPTVASAQEMPPELPNIYRGKSYRRAIDRAKRQQARKDAQAGRQIERIGSKSARGPNLTHDQQVAFDKLMKLREQAAKDCEELMKRPGYKPAVIGDAGIDIDRDGKAKLSLGGSRREAIAAARMRKCPEAQKEDSKELGRRLAEEGNVEVRRAFVIQQAQKKRRVDDETGPVQPGPQ